MQQIANIVVLNLPNTERITRRYMCSYASPVSLFPPYELLSVAGIIRDRLGLDVRLIDAIAEAISLEEVISRLDTMRPDLIVTITGFECFQADVEAIRTLHSWKPGNCRIALIGHYPTIFPGEVMEATHADYILHGEPDLSAIELIRALNANSPLRDIAGITFRSGDEIVSTPQAGRILDISSLPLPAHDLLHSDAYSEPLLPKPYGVIQSARGCPYQCNFCVRSYGSKLTEKTPEQIVAEIAMLVSSRNIRSFRFTDDTFTLNAKRVIRICQLLIESGLQYLEWACLSRVDNIQEEMIAWMSKAGCKRIYFGMESGSPKILKMLNKKTDVESAIRSLQLVKRYHIQTSGFFMLGIPGETLDDVRMSVDFAIRSQVDFIAIGKFTPYPGTQFYELFKDQVQFQVFPYRLVFDGDDPEKYAEYEKYFYKKFYLRGAYLANQIKLAVSQPRDSVRYFSKFMAYSFGRGMNALNHIQVPAQ